MRGKFNLPITLFQELNELSHVLRNTKGLFTRDVSVAQESYFGYISVAEIVIVSKIWREVKNM